MRFILATLCLLAALPALATPVDDFRALVRQGDRTGVIAALTAAPTEAAIADMTVPANPDPLRQLFVTFRDLHPDVDRFTRDWLAAAPDDPMAQTARGWQLLGQGFAWRGNAVTAQVWPERLTQMRDRHDRAMDLLRKAYLQRPDLLPASDGMLLLMQTVGDMADIPVIVDKVMQVRPNRITLMMAMYKLAPQWGGTQAQVDLLCDRFAGAVRDVGPYDARTCRIDAAFFTVYPPGPRMDTAWDALKTNRAPVLDYARLEQVKNGEGTPQERVNLLVKTRDQRDLTLAEAQAFDIAYSALKGLSYVDDLAVLDVVQPGLKAAQAGAEIAPLDAVAVQQYHDSIVGQMGRAKGFDGNDLPFPAEDMDRRIKAVLAAYPTLPNMWLLMGRDRVWRYGQPTHADALNWIEQAEPYYDNAIAYGMGARWVLEDALLWKLQLIGNYDLGSDPAPTAAETARRDTVLYCPAARQVALLLKVCAAEGVSYDACSITTGPVASYLPMISKRLDAGACPDLRSMTETDTLLYQPTDIDLTRPF